MLYFVMCLFHSIQSNLYECYPNLFHNSNSLLINMVSSCYNI